MCRCGMCGMDINDEEAQEIILEGTDDIYSLTLCEECYEVYGNDYFEPEQVDKMF